MSSTSKIDFLQDKAALRAFERALMKFVNETLKMRMSQLMPPENVQRLRHGGEWSHPGLPDAYNAGMHEHSSEVAIQFEELVNHDLSAISRHVGKLVEDMNAQFERTMFATLSAACDQSGNVVDASAAGGAMEGFAAMLETIRFSTDKHGNVQRPQMHLSPAAFKNFREAQETASPELLQRIQRLDELRCAEAVQAEVDRKARFVRYGETP